MLQIKNIRKEYRTGDLVQQALNDVSLTLRDNEFVAILGPSGSGKTTLLNIIGGLDRYDSGDLIINGISTQKYKDRDWDSYRNHTIGFVFQSYNLIPHQTILSNVELALTISGVSKRERKARAKEALEKVGLGEHINKKPNQLSGGQMQRVAIARALVNDPDILLADEPTGALDTDTSVQVMDLLAEVAKDRLVVMVTHNPELAESYANRIVSVRDGKIINDTNPYKEEAKEEKEAVHKNMGKASMSLLTSLSLSFNNLKTKKARTILTSFAGSIGIIGIALILALSNGVNAYIEKIQKDTMSSYPITIDATTIDLSSVIGTNKDKLQNMEEHALDGVYANTTDLEMAATMTTSITKNNLSEFKKYLDDKNSEIHKYVGSNGIVYSYAAKFSVFAYDPEKALVNTDGSTINPMQSAMQEQMMSSFMAGMASTNKNFSEILVSPDGNSISPAVKREYDVVYGKWPEAYNEVILVLNDKNEIASSTLYELGLLPSAEYMEYTYKMMAGEPFEVRGANWSYEDICNHTFYLVPSCDMYEEVSNGVYTSIADYPKKIEKLFKDGVQLKIVGLVKQKEDSKNRFLTTTVCYTRELTKYIIDYAKESPIMKAQLANPKINVLTGYEFGYIPEIVVPDEMIPGMEGMIPGMEGMIPGMEGMMPDMEGGSMPGSDSMGDGSMWGDLYGSSYTTTYEDNLTAFGYIDYNAPTSVNIYADSFENKDGIAECIEKYNAKVNENDKIVYTDYVGLLMSSITTIIDVISYVLIAFVSVSLIVSSIMIGIITYISVLERTKEIGILRAMGASKKNISQVFNAETFIIGLCAGVLGILVTLLVMIPGNAVIHSLTGDKTINAILPVGNAIVLIILSVVLTLIGGIIPSKKAAKQDPVTALRSE